jgi:hypothetical protein
MFEVLKLPKRENNLFYLLYLAGLYDPKLLKAILEVHASVDLNDPNRRYTNHKSHLYLTSCKFKKKSKIKVLTECSESTCLGVWSFACRHNIVLNILHETTSVSHTTV